MDRFLWGEEEKGRTQTAPLINASFTPQVETHRPHLRKGGSGGVGPEKKQKQKEEHAGSTLVKRDQAFSFPEGQGFHRFALPLLWYRVSSQGRGMSRSDPCGPGMP